MGLFDQYRNSGAVHPLEEAAAGILVAAMEADGSSSPEELNTWKYLIYCHPLFRSQPPDVFNPMMERIHRRLAEGNWRDALADWAGAIPAPLRPTVFALAVDLVLIDGVVTDNERGVIAHVQTAMGIPDQLAASIVTVMSIKCGNLLADAA